MQQWYHITYQFLANNAWIIQLSAIALATLLLQWFAHVTVARLEKQFSKRKAYFAASLLYSFRRPIGFLVWLIGFTLILELLAEQFGDGYTMKLIDRGWDLLLILLIVWTFLRVLRRTEERLLSTSDKKRKIDKTTLKAIGQISRGVIIGGGVLIILPQLGVPISGVVAFGGFGGIALTFAAKDLLSNYLGSMMVFFDRPFEVGDWVRVPDHDIEGTVETIEWRLSRIRTFDKRALYVPNSIFSTSVLENPSRMTHRRINTLVGIRYQDSDKLADIVSDVKAMVYDHPEIDNEQIILTNFVEFGSSSLNFIIYAFTHTTDWAKYFEIRQAIYLNTIDIIHHHGAQCALPATTINFAEPLAMRQLQQQDPSS